ncbi:DUF2637 domain-containing protein [Streptomyces sp. 2A115]|uniref:DUF2637 domain-containing protein n=1 Tax=Streptomyces sp. 2A115 TaxID=3457439 RepID=UPI003FD40647
MVAGLTSGFLLGGWWWRGGSVLRCGGGGGAMNASGVESVPGRGPRRVAGSGSSDLDAWLRRGCALVVAGVAAYASYVHQREFALQGGADEVSASLWPLSVDGLLLLATVPELHGRPDRTRPRQLSVSPESRPSPGPGGRGSGR